MSKPSFTSCLINDEINKFDAFKCLDMPNWKACNTHSTSSEIELDSPTDHCICSLIHEKNNKVLMMNQVLTHVLDDFRPARTFF